MKLDEVPLLGVFFLFFLGGVVSEKVALFIQQL
jgi:hypothetical protein